MSVSFAGLWMPLGGLAIMAMLFAYFGILSTIFSDKPIEEINADERVVFAIEGNWYGKWVPLQATCWRDRSIAEAHMKKEFVEKDTEGQFRVSEYRAVQP